MLDDVGAGGLGSGSVLTSDGTGGGLAEISSIVRFLKAATLLSSGTIIHIG